MALKKKWLIFYNNHFEWVRPVVPDVPLETLHINQDLSKKYFEDKWILKVYKINKARYKELLKDYCPPANICEDWISIPKSTVSGTGYGCFADRVLKKEDIISVYMTFDKRSKEKNNDNYGIHIAPDSFLYAKPTQMCLGDHFMNDRKHHCKNLTKVIKYESNGRNKQSNCTFRG